MFHVIREHTIGLECSFEVDGLRDVRWDGVGERLWISYLKDEGHDGRSEALKLGVGDYERAKAGL
jgi:hypothetical protein